MEAGKCSKELLNTGGRTLEDLFLIKKQKTSSKPEKTFKPPPSSVLNQVKDFLPKLAAANSSLETLLKRVPASQVDIEHIEDSQQNVIEMDLALVQQSSDDDTDTDSDSENEEYIGEVTEDNLRLEKKIKHTQKPLIECLSSNTESNNGFSEVTCVKSDDFVRLQSTASDDSTKDG